MQQSRELESRDYTWIDGLPELGYGGPGRLASNKVGLIMSIGQRKLAIGIAGSEPMWVVVIDLGKLQIGLNSSTWDPYPHRNQFSA